MPALLKLQQKSLIVAIEADFKSAWGYYCFSSKPKANLKKCKILWSG
jgi:hypothetical protein